MDSVGIQWGLYMGIYLYGFHGDYIFDSISSDSVGFYVCIYTTCKSYVEATYYTNK